MINSPFASTAFIMVSASASALKLGLGFKVPPEVYNEQQLLLEETHLECRTHSLVIVAFSHICDFRHVSSYN